MASMARFSALLFGKFGACSVPSSTLDGGSGEPVGPTLPAIVSLHPHPRANATAQRNGRAPARVEIAHSPPQVHKRMPDC